MEVCVHIISSTHILERMTKIQGNDTNSRPKSATFCLLIEIKRSAVQPFSSSRQAQNFIQSQFSTEGDLALPLIYSRFLNVTHQLLTSYSSSSLHSHPSLFSMFPLITCFIRHFLRKTRLIQLAFLFIFFTQNVPFVLDST